MKKTPKRIAARRRSKPRAAAPKGAGAAPREIESLFKTLFMKAPIGIALANPDFRFVDVNEASCRMLGYTRDELLQMTALDITHPDDRAEDIALSDRVAQGVSTGFGMEKRYITKNGAVLLVNLVTAGITGPDGRVRYGLGMVEDITEHKRTQEALRVSEERYRAVVEDQTELICRFRKDGTYTFVNEVYCRFFGKPARELVGQTWQPRVVTEDLPHIDAQLRILSPSHPVVTIENRVYSGNGQVRWMQFVNRGQFDAQGGLTEVQSVGRDITERKHAEEALRLRDRAINASTEGIVITGGKSADYAVEYVNQGFEQLTGYASSEILGRSLRLLRGPLTDRAAVRSMREATEAEQPSVTEILNYRKDRTPFWNRVSITPVRDETGQANHFICVSMNTTSRRRVEDALRQSEASLRTAQQLAQLGNYEYDVRQDKAVWSEEMFRITGFDPRWGEPTIAKYLESVHPADRHLVTLAVNEAISRRQSTNIEYRIRRTDGEIRYVTSILEPAPTVGEETYKLIGTLLDVTERKKAEERIREFAHELLSVREEEKQRLSATLHHDVGSLAVGLSARLNAVEDSLRAGKTEEALDLLAQSRTLFDHAVARLKTLAVGLHPPDLDILGLPAALRQYFTETTRSTAIRIRFDDHAQDPAISRDAATVLFRIVQESITNAIKHGHAKTVRVSLDAADGSARLAIRDDGCGFDPFRQSRTGTKMGLRAMKAMAESQGGTLELRSSPGSGAEVVAALPLTEQPATEGGAP